MRKVLFALAVVLLAGGCSKEALKNEVEPLQESLLYINLKNGGVTKATGAGHGVQADDNNMQTLEVFVFRINEGKPDDGVLDGYRKFTAPELAVLSNLEIRTTTGMKMIYVVANAHRENWRGVNTREIFERQTALLAEDNVRDFIMTGSLETELQLASTVEIPIRRLVSRIQVGPIRTAFDGGPYEGLLLEDVKVYLTNVQAQKFIHDGSGSNLKVLGNNGYNAEDAISCVMPGMIYEDLDTGISDVGYNSPVYFYCYENMPEKETDTEKFTRVVIEGVLDGVRYYYPIMLGKVERNNCYSLEVTISRPGALSPDSGLEKGVLVANLDVLEWNAIDGSVVEF